MSNTPRCKYGRLEDNQWEGCRLDPKISRREFLQWIFALGIFWGVVSRYAATPLIVVLPSGPSEISKFSPWSPIEQQEIVWINPKRFQTLLRRLAPLTFLIRILAFRDPLRGKLPHVQTFINDGPNSLTWGASVLSYWFSRNLAVFWDYLVNLINNLRGGHSFGSSRKRRITGGKITMFKQGHPGFDDDIRWCMFP